MRISTNTIYEQGIATMQRQQEALLKTQQQVSTGRRILTPADDPVAAARALEVSQSASANAQYAVNRNSAKGSLELEDSTMQSLTSLIQDVRTITINAGNPILTDNDRAAIAADLRGRLQQLTGLANTTDGIGQYLFSGYQGNVKPFTPTASGAQYSGDQGQRLIQASAARQIGISDSGSDVFERIKTGNGVFVTAAAAANSGGGVISPGSVVTPASLTGHNYQINFSVTAAAAATAGTAIGAGATTFTPDAAAVGTIAAGTMTLRFGTGPAVSVGAITLDGTNNAANTAAAFDAAYVLAGGTAGTFTAAAGVVSKAIDGDTVTFGITGTAVNPVAATTTQTTLAGQTGLSAAQLGTQAYAAATAYDVVDNSTTPAPTTLSSGNVYASGSAIAVDGMQFDIKGSPANGDQFTITPSSSQSLFKTLNDLIVTIANPVNSLGSGTKLTNGLNSAHLNLDHALDNVLRVRATVGSRLVEIDALDSSGSDYSLQYDQTLSQLQDVDYAKAISDLTRQQVYLEAAQKSYLKVTSLSLFQYI